MQKTSSPPNLSNKKTRDKIMSMLERSRNELSRIDQIRKGQDQIISAKDKCQIGELMQKSFYYESGNNSNGSVHFTIHKNNIDIKPFGYQLQSAQLNPQPIHLLPYQSKPIQTIDSHNSKPNHIPPSMNSNNVKFVNTNTKSSTIRYHQEDIISYQQPSNAIYRFSQVKPYVFFHQQQQQQLTNIKFIKPTQPQQILVVDNDDEQYEKPLKNKIKMNKVQKSTLISDEQIKRGFNNNFHIALNKVNKKQQQQMLLLNTNHSTQTPVKKEIQIISNLIHESYSPQSVQNIQNIIISSSQKKKKKRIFQSKQKRQKAISLYEQSNLSFGTPQSLRMTNNNNNNLQHSIFEYQLKTQREQEMSKLNRVEDDKRQQQYEQELPRQLVPQHILNAWQRRKVNTNNG